MTPRGATRHEPDRDPCAGLGRGSSPAETEYAIASSREAGFDLIEFPVFDPSAIDVAATSRALRTQGMGARCSLGLSLDTDISSADAAVVARGERLLGDVISVARDIGSPFVGGVIYSALTKYMEMPTEQGRDDAIGALRRLAERAAASDITLGLEIVNRYETNLINTAEQAVRFIDEIGAPNVVVHLDTYHMNIEETDFRTPVLACGDRLGYVHVGENFRGYLGTGTVDFPQLFAALAEVGYSGTVDVRELLVGRGRPWPVADARHLAQRLERQRGPGSPGAPVHRRRGSSSRPRHARMMWRMPAIPTGRGTAERTSCAPPFDSDLGRDRDPTDPRPGD